MRGLRPAIPRSSFAVCPIPGAGQHGQLRLVDGNFHLSIRPVQALVGRTIGERVLAPDDVRDLLGGGGGLRDVVEIVRLPAGRLREGVQLPFCTGGLVIRGLVQNAHAIDQDSALLSRFDDVIRADETLVVVAKPSAEMQRLEAAKKSNKDIGYTTDDGPANVPILFEAKVQLRKGTSASGIVVQYSISAMDLNFSSGSDGMQHAQFKVAALAYDTSGEVLSSTMDDVSTHYSAAQMDEVKHAGVPMLQQVSISKRAKFLLLTVIDVKTGRTGTRSSWGWRVFAGVSRSAVRRAEPARRSGGHSSL